MVDVELAILELARRVVVVRGALIKKLVTTIDVLDLKVIGGGPGQGGLRAFLVELFSVQAIGGSAEIAPVNVPREHTRVVACSVRSIGAVKAGQGGSLVSEAVGINIVDAGPIVLSLDHGAGGLIGEAEDRLAGVVEVAQQRIGGLGGIDCAVTGNDVGRIPLA